MRALSIIALVFSLAACNETRARPATPPNPFDWTTTPDGRLQPPDGPCTRDQECTLRTDCGCGCFAVRTDFTDNDHRCVQCAAQVPLCLGATARCDHATRHCAVAR